MQKPTITLKHGKAKESGREYTALILTVGEWSTLFFPKSQFETEYIKKYMAKLEQSTNQESIDDFADGLN